jgi:hypothetical protein
MSSLSLFRPILPATGFCLNVTKRRTRQARNAPEMPQAGLLLRRRQETLEYKVNPVEADFTLTSYCRPPSMHL